MAGGSTHGDDTPFGFRIPSSWPKWKKRCGVTNRISGTPCKAFAIRGMNTCRMHGSGGYRNAKVGLIRYLAWITIGAPPDIPWFLAKYASTAAVLEQLFNKGVGTPEQRLRAGMWLIEMDDPEKVAGRPPIQRMIVDDVSS